MGGNLINQYASYYETYSNPLQCRVIKEAGAFSFSGTVYCCLTTFRDRIYFEKIEDASERGWKSVMPSGLTSITMRAAMEPLQALLALAAVVEFVVRFPFALLACLALYLHNCDGISLNKTFFSVVVHLCVGEVVTFMTAINSIQNMYYNLFNSPIISSSRNYDIASCFTNVDETIRNYQSDKYYYVVDSD